MLYRWALESSLSVPEFTTGNKLGFDTFALPYTVQSRYKNPGCKNIRLIRVLRQYFPIRIFAL